MTDTYDTRDKPLRKRVGRDGHTDWLRQRMGTEQTEWLQGNGKLTPLHFATGWPAGVPRPDPDIVKQVAEHYNARMREAAGLRKQPTYQQFFNTLKEYEGQLAGALAQEHPSLQEVQISAIVSVCADFRARWVSDYFKTVAERVPQKSGGRS